MLRPPSRRGVFASLANEASNRPANALHGTHRAACELVKHIKLLGCLQVLDHIVIQTSIADICCTQISCLPSCARVTSEPHVRSKARRVVSVVPLGPVGRVGMSTLFRYISIQPEDAFKFRYASIGGEGWSRMCGPQWIQDRTPHPDPCSLMSSTFHPNSLAAAGVSRAIRMSYNSVLAEMLPIPCR